MFLKYRKGLLSVDFENGDTIIWKVLSTRDQIKKTKISRLYYRHQIIVKKYLQARDNKDLRLANKLGIQSAVIQAQLNKLLGRF